MPERSENRLFEAFHQLFEEKLPGHHFSHREAFEETNSHFENTVRFRPFGSYESFKSSKSRFHKKRKR